MVLALKPFGCMPSSQSDGVQSAVVNRFPEMIFLPIETSGEGEINAHSRVQMALGEARVKARRSSSRRSASTGRSSTRSGICRRASATAQSVLSGSAPPGIAGVAANFVLHVGDLMDGKARLAHLPGEH